MTQRVVKTLRTRAGLWSGIRPLLLIGVPLLTGCYAHVPVNVETVTPPMRVRAYLTPQGMEKVSPILGGARSELDGRLVERSPRGVFLEVRAGEMQAGMRTEVLTQRILFEPTDLQGLQRRQLDRVRTAIAATVGVAAVGALVYDALSGESGESIGGRPTPGPPEARLPLVRIPFR